MIILKNKQGILEFFSRYNDTIFIYQIFNDYESVKPELFTTGQLIEKGYCYVDETEGKISMSNNTITK